MRIAFDGSSLRPHRTGVGYYGEHLLRHLAHTLPSDDELIVISNRPVETTSPLPDRVQVVHGSRRVPRLVWMQTDVPTLLKRLGADVAHFTNGIDAVRQAHAHGGDDPRHEPEAAAALSPDAARPSEPSADGLRCATRRCHHHSLPERAP